MCQSSFSIEQLYFALRLASADLLYEDDEFPLFLDDVFGNYDDERLRQTLAYLNQKTTGRFFYLQVEKKYFMYWIRMKFYITLFPYSFFCAKIYKEKVTKGD